MYEKQKDRTNLLTTLTNLLTTLTNLSTNLLISFNNRDTRVSMLFTVFTHTLHSHGHALRLRLRLSRIMMQIQAAFGATENLKFGRYSHAIAPLECDAIN
jgi:hypothetical protein